MNAADYFQNQLELFDNLNQQEEDLDFSAGKTCRVHLQADQSVALILERSLKPSQKPIFQCLRVEDGQRPEWFNAQTVKLRGEHLTLNIGYHNGVKESSLSQILQKPTEVPEKYYLSAKACRGILRRAAERGKELPVPLKKALEQQANSSNGGG